MGSSNAGSAGRVAPQAGNRLVRILRHRWFDEGDTARALDAAALARLEQQVAASERRHSGEIRLCVEAGLPLSYLWRRAAARERAVALFGKLRVWDTEHNNGVLVYLLLAEHAIEIVADRGLARHVPPAHWTEVLAGMREAFRAGRFEAGLQEAVKAVDAMLAAHFPLAAGAANPNELPDAADLR
ncbi:MAG: TPM domain-containing protein [Burkholderiales bacterium]|nr:TPM domain-containing protein [Burkholderiales bacterium]